MNPFDLRGPQFLGFYCVLSVVVFATVWLVTSPKRRGIGRPGHLPINDPLLIAHLRGGPAEVVTVVVASLIDRGFLSMDSAGRLVAVARDRSSLRATEKSVLEACGTSKTVAGCRVNKAVRASCAELERQLAEAGLTSTAVKRSAPLTVIVVGTLALLIVGVVKLVLAHQRGRSNTGGLIAMLIADGFIGMSLVGTLHARVTSKVIGDLRTLFSGLRHRATRLRRGESTVDVEFLAAVFGASAIPLTVLPERDHLFPRPRMSSPDDGGTGAGTSCGSSSSCGGGCGGGGGGCGGCGS